MEAALADFLEESWSSNDDRPSRKKRVEGVWVTARNGLGEPEHRVETPPVHEDDEMIWWSWDGKLVGFADW